MVTGDQTEVVEFLASPSTHGGSAVERVDTHASIIFLAGDSAWKLKRAVRYNYLDFSTVDRRRAMCEAEVRTNRRFAPQIYRGVIAVAREADGTLALNGAGAPIEWLVHMRRFDQNGLFDRLAARGALDPDLMRPLGVAIARLHASAERRADQGGVAGISWVIDGNATGFVEQGSDLLDTVECARVIADSRGQVVRHGALLNARREAGLVRQGHGDLHLRNIVLLDGQPTLFDAIEFNDAIACGDVLYDLAFLLMDLWRRGLPAHANAVWNGYLAETRDTAGLPLLPLFLSCRAAVRAKTSMTAARLETDLHSREGLVALARSYLSLAGTLLTPPPPCLLAIGGLSGSGKSTLARTVAPALGAVPGAVVIRSDETRKQLCGATPLERLGPECYTPDVTRRVYNAVAHRAAHIVAGGQAAIVDAVFAGPDDRTAIATMAAAARVPFIGIWLEAPQSVRIGRVTGREREASDATAAVVRQQAQRDLGDVTWLRIDASLSRNAVLRLAVNALQTRLEPADIRLSPLSTPDQSASL